MLSIKVLDVYNYMSAAYTAPVICLFTPCVQQPHAAELLVMTLYLVMVLYLAKALDSRSEVQPPALPTPDYALFRLRGHC